MIYHNEYIVESFSTTTKQSYYILLVISKEGKTKRGLSRINNALRLYLRNQGVVECLLIVRTCCCLNSSIFDMLVLPYDLIAHDINIWWGFW